MESAPPTPEDDNDDEDLDGKKKKKAESLGAWLVEAKPEQPEDQAQEKSESLWDQLNKKFERQSEEKTAEASEAEAPLEELSQTEVEYIEQEIIRAEMAAEPEAAADPAEAAVRHFRQKVVEEDKTTDEALAETLAEVEPEEATIPEDAPREITENEGEIYTAGDDDEEAPVTTATTAAGGAAGGGSGNGSGGTGSGGSTGSGGPGGPGTPPPHGPGGPYGPFGPAGVAPAAPGATLTTPGATLREPDYRIDASPVANLLIGGIVGYLIGRRRGRIKTEKRLLPIQKKLEKQVEALQWDIRTKEQRIRRVVRERDSAQSENMKRRVAPEANQLHAALPAEKIGQVLVTAEALPAAKAEAAAQAKAEKLSPEKRVETLDRHDLLEMSEKVIIEATTLRQLYETNLIGERGLRRLLIEHLRGGDVKRQLRRELVERQIDYERDPILRDRTPLDSSRTAGSVALKQMFKQVDKLSSSEAKEELAIYKAREAYQTAQGVKNKQRRRQIDAALATAITVLAIAVLLLLLTRH